MTAQWSQRKIIKRLASLKLAVVIMIYLAILTAVGTIFESMYDAEAAKKIIYDTAWMYVGMFALSVSLIAVMMDRWPWKVRHTPFLLAHVGILLLLFGSVLTMKYGLDGSMSVDIGKSSRQVVLPMETDVLVYASFGGQNMTKLLEEPVDFFRRPPTSEKPMRIKTDEGDIEIVDYKKYVLPSRKVLPATEKMAGAGVRFQVQNPNVSVVEWLVQRSTERLATHDFGPAQIHLGPRPPHPRGKNEIWLTPAGDHLEWALYRRDATVLDKVDQGVVSEGGLVKTGWMGLELRILRYMPAAREEWDFEERDAPTPLTTSAMKLKFKGREQWVLLNDTVRLFTDQTAYLVSFLNRRIDMDFELQLKRFDLIPYEGTNKAKEYKSLVTLPDAGDIEISMNKPAMYRGLRIFQASFQNDERGQPTASVFSVNYDPGRWWKYIGSLVMSLGIIALFWFRRFGQKKKAPVQPNT